MKYYVATMNDDFKSTLIKIKSGESILLFYTNNNSMVPISLVDFLIKSKVLLESVCLEDEKFDVMIAHKLGMLAEKNELVSISNNDTINMFCGVKNKKQIRTKRENPNKEIKNEEKEKPELRKVKDVKETKNKIKPLEKKTSANNKTKKDEFDVAFEELNDYILSVDASLLSKVPGILGTIKSIEKEKMELKDAVSIHFSSGKDKIEKFIENNYEEIKKKALKVIALDSKNV